jgi:hypothetical protein
VTTLWPGVASGASLAEISATPFDEMRIRLVRAPGEEGSCLVSSDEGSQVCARDGSAEMAAGGAAATLDADGFTVTVPIVATEFLLAGPDAFFGGNPNVESFPAFFNAKQIAYENTGTTPGPEYTLSGHVGCFTLRLTQSTILTFADGGFAGPAFYAWMTLIVVQGNGGGHSYSFAQASPELVTTGWSQGSTADGSADVMRFFLARNAAGQLRVAFDRFIAQSWSGYE